MTNYYFIFSNKPAIRFARHVCFWIAFGIHFFIQSLLIPGVNEALTPRTPFESLINTFCFLPVYIISVYIFIEIIIPRLLFKTRYGFFFISTISLLIFNFAACYFTGLLYEHIELKIPYNQITFAQNKYNAIVNGLFVSGIVLAITGGIKVAKKWIQKQRENEALAREKVNTELQLLKIQINPRFLFHSLHAVKQHILVDSPRSPKLILQVADLLSYILYESNQDYVTLEKELAVINDYISLEENSINENLKMIASANGDVTGKYIVPLILLSIIQTSFEFFPEGEQGVFSKLFIDVRNHQLDLVMIYNTANDHTVELLKLCEKFEDIRKQLKNLYPDNHEFAIESRAGAITISLKNLPLHTPELTDQAFQTTSNTYENV
ncbi:MAG TPA: histidine kinase [Ginsengibacter sp.]